ncbi:MAG: cytochrome C oxidase subunit IV family protein [Bacteroidota bacterium]
MNTEENKVVVQPVDSAKVKHLVKIAAYLFFVTVIEFVVAFTMGAGGLRTSLFVIMTIVKAFYIIFEFMHLGHEVKGLRWSVIFPMILVVWLIIALLMEGSYIHVERFF